MKKVIISIFLVVGLLVGSNAHAWLNSTNVSIRDVVEWQDNSPIYFTLSNDNICFIPASDEILYRLILTLYATQNTGEFVCADDTTNFGGINGHRLHRVRANN